MLKRIVLLILCLGLAIAAGCGQKTDPDGEVKPGADTVLSDFNALLQGDAGMEEVAGFLDENISGVSREDAAGMVDAFEKMQKEELPRFEGMFMEEDVQNKINSEYASIMAGTEVKDPELKEFLAPVQNSGYRVETAEGMYFPIIDYGFYEKFSSHVTDDMKDYINLMAVESAKVPAKDAALVIGWDEIIARALNQEKFLNTYGNSAKADDIKELYNKYVAFTYYGLNNTPLFSYDTNTMVPEAREVYAKAILEAGDSELLNELIDFMDLLDSHNYRLTDEISEYRNDVVRKLVE